MLQLGDSFNNNLVTFVCDRRYFLIKNKCMHAWDVRFKIQAGKVL